MVFDVFAFWGARGIWQWGRSGREGSFFVLLFETLSAGRLFVCRTECASRQYLCSIIHMQSLRERGGLL